MPEPESIADRGNDGSTSSTPSRGQSGGEAGPSVGGSIIGVLLTLTSMIVAGVASVVSTLWNDRALAAFGRQGIDELGTAFGKALPDSIQHDEIGSIWNPPQSDLGDGPSHNRQGNTYSSLTPPRGWAEKENGQDNARGRDNGQDRDAGMSM